MRLMRFHVFCASLALAASISAQERPNILFCIADDASWAHFGAYGCNWVNTPGFDRIAREGLLFTRAYTPNAKCAPSRAAILTGRNSWQLKEAANHMNNFPAEFLGFIEALSSADYFVGNTGKGWAPGLAIDAEGVERQLTGPDFETFRSDPPAKSMSSLDYATNFVAFLNSKPEDQPFCFWYGATEPHRAYEYGASIAKGGKSIDQIDGVPSMWPDNETVRTDMLDYGFEIEHFDRHLARMIDSLEERGLLENTLIVVTSDNGMPFPRIKGQEYEYSNHMPLAIMWPKGIKNPGRTVTDYVSFIDFAPTFLEVAGLQQAQTGMARITGRTLTDLFDATESGQIDPTRDHVLIGKERHDVGRPNNQGYPIRGIFKDGWLFLHNYEPSRWPAGNPETGYLNTDGSPTKSFILDLRRSGENQEFWQQNFGKRPEFELYNVEKDPHCVTNLAENPEFATQLADLRETMVSGLEEQDDPRIQGKGYIFEQYGFAWDEVWLNFYERLANGEEIKTGWVLPTDFDRDLLEARAPLVP